MHVELFIVPDYYCSGVVERYFKVSCVISNGNGHEVVVSAIINKKSDALQRQAKLDPPPKIKRTAIYGWDRSSAVIDGLSNLLTAYPTLTDEEKQRLYRCMISLRGATVMAWNKMAQNPIFDHNERVEADNMMSDLYKAYCDLRNGVTVNTPAPQVVEENSPAPQEKQEDTPSPSNGRRMSTMARMMNAHYLTEFVEGNIYGIKENSDLTVNGKTYVTLLNENGEERQIDKSRIEVISSFDEPPTK